MNWVSTSYNLKNIQVTMLTFCKYFVIMFYVTTIAFLTQAWYGSINCTFIDIILHHLYFMIYRFLLHFKFMGNLALKFNITKKFLILQFFLI